MSEWDDKYCDFCRSNTDPRFENDRHEDWCPVLEVLRLRAALRETYDLLDGDICDHPEKPGIMRRAKEALGSDE